MNKFVTVRPKKRSKVRLFLGKRYFTLKKFIDWYLAGKKFCSGKDDIENYPFVVFTHCTPLLRKLKDVDMWMQHNKVKNLEIALKELDGLVLKPEEVFSYWKLIGKPTKSKGYLQGMQLDHGKFIASIGGGLCQLSNLIYWMTLHTPLIVVERWRHSYDVFPDSNRKQPFGSGATCSYNYIDLLRTPIGIHFYFIYISPILTLSGSGEALPHVMRDMKFMKENTGYPLSTGEVISDITLLRGEFIISLMK